MGAERIPYGGDGPPRFLRLGEARGGQADRLIEGLPPTPEQRAKGEQRVVQAGRDYVAGSTAMVPINPPATVRMTASVGAMIFGSGRFSTRMSPGAWITVARMTLS
ncbi:hypothetical protein ABZY09_08860 [Streptomyces sp. NPDC002928]|uniref:hypothetical protein n=1 Tax=Streptomyces sp. NPDC002928 TaxID=3154440 RepID=UPI0033AE2580